jgi:hypothetical protein
MSLKWSAVLMIFVAMSGMRVSLKTDRLTYLPCDQVQVSGQVTYNLAPIIAQLVAVSVLTPDNKTLEGLVFQTDENGNFNFTFRLPYNAEAGLWTVVARSTIGNSSDASACTQFYVAAYNITVQNQIVIPVWLQVLITITCMSTIMTCVVILRKGRKRSSPNDGTPSTSKPFIEL